MSRTMLPLIPEPPAACQSADCPVETKASSVAAAVVLAMLD
jgi:hypothetical protein